MFGVLYFGCFSLFCGCILVFVMFCFVAILVEVLLFLRYFHFFVFWLLCGCLVLVFELEPWLVSLTGFTVRSLPVSFGDLRTFLALFGTLESDTLGIRAVR